MYEPHQHRDGHHLSALLPAARGSAKKIILGILVLIAIGIGAVLFISHGDITNVATKQLNMIKKGKLKQAYDMTADGFKNATSYEVFETYINNNPVFNTFKKVSFTETQIKDNSGYLKGVIDSDNGQMSVEYHMTKNNGKWEILAIQLTPIGVDTSEGPMQTTSDDVTTQNPTIHGILVSDIADNDGFVEETKPIVPRSAKKIFATVMIVAPTADINVEASLKHLPTGVILGPIESKTTKTGNIMKAFSFTREKQLWPAGEYEIDVKLSSGDMQTLQFEVK